jgi:hypothetical protein
MDKYGINFSDEAKDIDKKRLINQLWKLIPMKENDEDWQMHLAVIIEEITGLVKLYNNKAEGLILLSKLEGLTSVECDDFVIYRKTIFRCIDLLSQVMEYGQL